jgi:hypothetical protein
VLRLCMSYDGKSLLSGRPSGGGAVFLLAL